MGPDGFNFKFIKEFWKLLEGDTIRFLNEYHVNGVFPKGCNSSFIALIPKVIASHSLGEFKSISFVSYMYKILAMFLSNRLKRVLRDVIHQRKSAFLGGDTFCIVH